jgi:hypothetical protein
MPNKDVWEAMLLKPYRDMANWHLSQKTWNPIRRARHVGFAYGLIAAIDLIQMYLNQEKSICGKTNDPSHAKSPDKQSDEDSTDATEIPNEDS